MVNNMIDYIFLRPKGINAYKRPNCGIPAITGLFLVTPDGLEPRMCYETTYDDGFIDYVPVSDVNGGAYELVVQ